MKLNLKLFLLASALIVVSIFVLNHKNKETAATSKNTDIMINAVTTQLPSIKMIATAPTALTSSKNEKPLTKTSSNNNQNDSSFSQGALSSEEVSSVRNIIKTISMSIAQKYTSNQFMKAVQKIKLKPQFIDEGSNAVGSLVTVRTHDALEGTRYLHAQFTGEKNHADYLQHISFQIRPGSDSFQKAVEILNQVLPQNKTVKESSSDYILFNTEDGYVAWAKIANREDLKSNKYNASSQEDIGTVIVTIEQEIHDMDEGHSNL